MVVDQEKLAKLQSAVRTGGKGAPRRKVCLLYTSDAADE